MELYTKAMLHELQMAINSGNYKTTTYNSYDGTFLGEGNRMFSNGITMNFRADASTGRRYVELYIANCGVYEGIGSKYMLEWRDTAAGKFMKKDWRDETKDILGNIIYHRIEVTMPNGDKLEGIIRDLVDYYDEENDEIKALLKRKYGDLTIDDHLYSLVKLWDTSKGLVSVMSQATFGSYVDDSLKNEEYSYSMIASEDEDGQAAQEAETPASEQLF